MWVKGSAELWVTHLKGLYPWTKVNETAQGEKRSMGKDRDNSRAVGLLTEQRPQGGQGGYQPVMLPYCYFWSGTQYCACFTNTRLSLLLWGPSPAAQTRTRARAEGEKWCRKQVTSLRVCVCVCVFKWTNKYQDFSPVVHLPWLYYWFSALQALGLKEQYSN